MEARPWTSISICDRVITFDSMSYSLYTEFKYEQKTEDEDQEGELVEEKNLPGTLYSM